MRGSGDVRVGLGVQPGVGGLPDPQVRGLRGGRQGERGGVQHREAEALVDEGVVDPDRLRVGEPGGAQDAEDRLDGGDLVGAPGGAVRGEQRGLRVGAVAGVDPQADLAQVGPPVAGGLPALLGAGDQLLGEGEQQVVGAVEVAVDGAGVGAQRGAEPADGQRLRPVLADQPQRGVDDQLLGEHHSLLGRPPAAPLGLGHYAFAHPRSVRQRS